MPNKRTSRLMTISLPPSLYSEAIERAKKEGRTQSELVRESLRKYLSEKRWESLLEYGRRKTAQTGLRPEDIEAIVDGLRQRKA